jgi:ferritin-like metal-binding protein YciE
MPAAPQQTENQEMAQVRSKDRSARQDEYGLENREYRDERGDVHHHTRSYMERHGETSEPERRQGQDRRRSAAPPRQRRTQVSDMGSSLGNFARNIANRPVFLLAAAAAAGTFFLSRRMGEEDFSRRGYGRDRDNEGFIPGASWLREEILPSPETPRDVFITGLRNAHSVEVKAVQLLERQMEALTDYPDIRTRLDQHLRETRSQIDRLETILRELGESPSTIKDTLLAAFGNALVIPQGMAGDAILKSAFASFAFENYEIAAYKSLITMTEVVGMPQFRAPLEATLREETAMAQWVGDNIPAVTRRYMSEVKAEQKS